MQTLQSYLAGRWVAATGRSETLVNPATEEVVAEAPQEGVDVDAALAFARDKGGPALRAMSFAARGEMLKALAASLHAQRDALLDLAMLNGGNTRSDAKFDVDGAIGTLQAYAELGQSLGDARYLVDGDPVVIGRGGRVAAQHLRVPRQGVALHLNAFNFPAWGLAEKAAVALLAGVPVVARPNPVTALVTWQVMQHFVDTGALPEGALSLLTAHHDDVVDRLGPQDILAFTGSAATAAMLRGRAGLVSGGARANFEADSLNAAVLGADVEPGSDLWQLFLADVVRDMTQKTGQKCTAIRRVLVPRARLDDVAADLLDRLGTCKVGDPRTEGVTMGPVTTAAQLRSVRGGIDRLVAAGARVLTGGSAPVEGLGAPAGKGYFVAPTLLVADRRRGPRGGARPRGVWPRLHAHPLRRRGGGPRPRARRRRRARVDALHRRPRPRVRGGHHARGPPRARVRGEQQGARGVGAAGYGAADARARRPGARGRRRGARRRAGLGALPPARGRAGLRALRRSPRRGGQASGLILEGGAHYGPRRSYEEDSS
jgi:3,4-dehydroadipyl-CoA semialdehyde dehydrogenase